jgi:hypothetical protein
MPLHWGRRAGRVTRRVTHAWRDIAAPPPARHAGQPRFSHLFTIPSACSFVYQPGQSCVPWNLFRGGSGCCTPGFACQDDSASPTGKTCQQKPDDAQTFAFVSPASTCTRRVQPGGTCGECAAG